MSARHVLFAAASLAACGVALAADEDVPGDEAPDLEFLEYLGMWEESDEEWLVLEEPIARNSEQGSDPAPDGEESTEKYDES